MDSILTVATAATDFSLVELDDVKTELQIVDVTDDVWLTAKIKRLSAAAAKYCDRIFVEQGYSEAFSLTSPANAVRLTQYPIISVSGITMSGASLDASQYGVDTGAGIIEQVAFQSCAPGWLSTAFVVGYSAGFTEIPDDIQEAVIEAIKGAYKARNRDPALRAVDQPGIGREEYWIGTIPGQQGALPPVSLGLLEPYRRLSV